MEALKGLEYMNILSMIDLNIMSALGTNKNDFLFH